MLAGSNVRNTEDMGPPVQKGASGPVLWKIQGYGPTEGEKEPIEAGPRELFRVVPSPALVFNCRPPLLPSFALLAECRWLGPKGLPSRVASRTGRSYPPSPTLNIPLVSAVSIQDWLE
ncbi:hypothetical protein Y032_0197g1580 [Ancylostoma ceylanicum]|uniref:Uncharacterized protein n=1 Tax=Ancylostoma ceylanicum TaxID=53326 RepID=A0A016SPA0_9BILA|nr:hypothetical protein Y032_0197g1580 [Ancylostoma ceylanicum]